MVPGSCGFETTAARLAAAFACIHICRQAPWTPTSGPTAIKCTPAARQGQCVESAARCDLWPRVASLPCQSTEGARLACVRACVWLWWASHNQAKDKPLTPSLGGWGHSCCHSHAGMHGTGDDHGLASVDVCVAGLSTMHAVQRRPAPGVADACQGARTAAVAFTTAADALASTPIPLYIYDVHSRRCHTIAGCTCSSSSRAIMSECRWIKKPKAR